MYRNNRNVKKSGDPNYVEVVRAIKTTKFTLVNKDEIFYYHIWYTFKLLLVY
jgi:hypothetical protein